MKKYIILYLLVSILFSIISIEPIKAQLTSVVECQDVCLPIDLCYTGGKSSGYKKVGTCQYLRGDAFSSCMVTCEAQREADKAVCQTCKDNAKAAAPPPETSSPSSPSVTTPLSQEEIDRREKDRLEARDKITRIKAETAKIKKHTAMIKEETAALVEMTERAKNGEVEWEDVPCEDITDQRLRDVIRETKNEYRQEKKDYILHSALTSNKKLFGIRMEDGNLKCHRYKEISAEERQRRQDEADAIKAKNDAIKAENDLIGIEDDAYNDMQKRIENKEMVRKEVACNGLTDSRVVEKINKMKSSYAADGEDIARVALTSDKKLHFVKIIDDELYCYSYRGAGVIDVVPQNREVHGTIKVNKGVVRILRDGLITHETDGYEVRAGDTIRTDKDGIIGVVSKDGLVQLHGDTVVGFIGLEFDPVAERRVINPPPDAPWAYDRGSFKHEIDDMAFWNDLYDDLEDFHMENKPGFIVSCGKALIGDALALASCGMDAAAFVYGGTAWFQKKIEKDKAAGIVLTPTVAITTAGTEFTVEVAEDGTTTVTTLKGNVIVTDLTTRNSVEVGTDEQVIVSLAAGLVEEPQQNVEVVDDESIDKWWSEELIRETADVEYPKLPLFVIFLVISAVLWLINRRLKKKGKKASWGKWSLISGIFGFWFSIIPLIGLAPSFGAIYFYKQQKKIKSNKKAIAGLVLGIMGMFVSFISLAVLILSQ